MLSNEVQPVERSEGAGSVKSAARVLDVLEFLAAQEAHAGVSEIARRLGIPKSSTSLLLSTLESRGYVLGDEARRFRIHPAYARDRTAWVGGARALLLQAVQPLMLQLSRTTGESAFLGAARDRNTLEYIAKVVSAHEVRCDAEIGQARPLHSTSLGLVILAFQPQVATDAYLARTLERLTPRTTTDPARLRKELSAVRRQGYAVTRDTNALGASGVAVPVIMTDGQVAALNVSAPTSRFEAVLDRATAALLAGAASIAREFRPGLEPSRVPPRLGSP